MDSVNPWAMPPPAATGDPSDTVLFAAVGEALSAWEWIEAHLGLLFSEFVAPGRPSLAASRAYGAITTHTGRADMLRRAAEAYFTIGPDPTLKAELSKQMKGLGDASPRRNDIAHGIVQPFDFGPAASSWALYPSYYATNRRQVDGTPAYVMTAAHIGRFAQQFREFQPPLMNLLDQLHAKSAHL